MKNEHSGTRGKCDLWTMTGSAICRDEIESWTEDIGAQLSYCPSDTFLVRSEGRHQIELAIAGRKKVDDRHFVVASKKVILSIAVTQIRHTSLKATSFSRPVEPKRN
jgi:hypothetical protein